VIDTHAHLDALVDARGALARARAAGVTRVIAVATDASSARTTLELCERETGVYAALGIHPHSAGDVDGKDVVELRRLLEHPRAVAIGETGLDHYRDYAPRDRQAAAFRAQLELAVELRKPVVVHSRAADDDTVVALGAVDGDVPVVLHCFSSRGLLEPALERGWYVSFAGNVTYPKAPDLREAAARVPSGRLLAETDSPYLAPQPVRGRTNEPAYVVHTLAAIAEARGEDARDVERAIEANAVAVFGLP
jgi:TatD DNase family protein